MRVGMADGDWIRRLRHRLDDFEATTRRAGMACSLKWRVVRGRFDRESAPEAYRLIDAAVRRSGALGGWVEAHSNGPELLVYLVPMPDGLAVGGKVAALLTELANARKGMLQVTESLPSGTSGEEKVTSTWGSDTVQMRPAVDPMTIEIARVVNDEFLR